MVVDGCNKVNDPLVHKPWVVHVVNDREFNRCSSQHHRSNFRCPLNHDSHFPYFNPNCQKNFVCLGLSSSYSTILFSKSNQLEQAEIFRCDLCIFLTLFWTWSKRWWRDFNFMTIAQVVCISFQVQDVASSQQCSVPMPLKNDNGVAHLIPNLCHLSSSACTDIFCRTIQHLDPPLRRI